MFFNLQESWNFRPFNNGKQNRNSAKASKSIMDSTSVKDDNSETAAHGNTPRAPSKHQQKAARKAERVFPNNLTLLAM